MVQKVQDERLLLTLDDILVDMQEVEVVGVQEVLYRQEEQEEQEEGVLYYMLVVFSLFHEVLSIVLVTQELVQLDEVDMDHQEVEVDEHEVW